MPQADNPVPAARLVSRVYRAAGQPLRALMLDCLMRPLGTLGLAAVAAGAFAPFALRGDGSGPLVTADEAARYSSQQVFELARFVHEVSPETLQRLAGLLASNAMGVAAFSVSALLALLLRSVRTVEKSER